MYIHSGGVTTFQKKLHWMSPQRRSWTSIFPFFFCGCGLGTRLAGGDDKWFVPRTTACLSTIRKWEEFTWHWPAERNNGIIFLHRCYIATTSNQLINLKLSVWIIPVYKLRRLPLVKPIILSLFVSMSFATPSDYSVVNVRVVGNQPAVMIYNVERTVLIRRQEYVAPGLDLCWGHLGHQWSQPLTQGSPTLLLVVLTIAVYSMKDLWHF